ncbi:tachykinin-like peptides receptor 86C [Nilaparvata lugens]|uniref:tachykinin-like peptides receptor 86C n=1 Tax=Nilaparvata lugens TaxID=108931 RepID=UPI00193E27BB|nr:tachykinin-like peptides receptor 86C [Nilaparvata lugens]
MRTVTNYLLVNLSLADLLMSLLNCIFNFIFMVNSHWPFGAFYCTVNNFVANFTVADSVFTLVAISIDRYLAIVHPLKHRTSKKRALLMLLSVWLASTLLAIPCILYSTTMTKRYKNGNYKTICYMKWPDGQYPQSSREYIYNLIFLGFTYLIPVVSMAACYGVIGHHLWGSKSIGERTQRQLQAITAKRKVVRMLITVVSIFALCWLPYHSYFIFAYHNQSVAVKTYIQHIYLAFYWLAMSNAMVNPIIYYWMNKKFRIYFKKAICRCSVCKPVVNLPPITTLHNQQNRRFNKFLRQGSHSEYITGSRSACLRLSPSTQTSCRLNARMRECRSRRNPAVAMQLSYICGSAVAVNTTAELKDKMHLEPTQRWQC